MSRRSRQTRYGGTLRPVGKRPGRQRTVRIVAVLASVLIVFALGAAIYRHIRTDPESPARLDDSNVLFASDEPLPSVPGWRPGRRPAVAEKFGKREASGDVWDTEVFQEAAMDQLRCLGELLSHPAALDVDALGELAAPEFSCGALRPSGLLEEFRGDVATVRRMNGTERPDSNRDPEHKGPTGLRTALEAMLEPLGEASESDVEFKIVGVDPGQAAVETTVYFHLASHDAGGAVQQNAVWRCQWVRSASDDPPSLRSISVREYEEVTSPNLAGSWYADCTESVLGGNESFGAQLVQSIDHWLGRLDVSLGLSWDGHEGIAIGDANGDGLDDLFVCQPGGLPNRLYLQNADGTASDASQRAGLDYLDDTSSALFADFDNDGDQDLFVVTNNDLFLMRNDGNGRFDPAGIVPVPSAHTISAADFDNDGDLDVYVCCYSAPYKKDSAPIPYHDANTGRANVMLRNDGPGRFTDITRQCGLNVNNRRFSFAASWEDFDDDGDLDLYVANDYGRNNLYRNDEGHFTDIARLAGVEDISAGMSVSWADYNNDGLMDVYVGNMFSSAGNRITYQRRFKTGVDESIRAQFQRHARGNSLFENAGDGTFHDVSVAAGVTMGRWAWSSNFLDFNNDGCEDILVANGFVTGEDTKDL